VQEEDARYKDFLIQLTRIERQAARVFENPNLDAANPPGRLQERGVDLLTSVIKYFNSAFQYFLNGLFGTVTTILWFTLRSQLFEINFQGHRTVRRRERRYGQCN
jgi:hypothetical protein